MKLLLTSFGLTGKNANPSNNNHLFYRMPPVSMDNFDGSFVPDYTSLIFCQNLIMDEASFAILSDDLNPLYSLMGETLKALYSEGFIELINFDTILQENNALLQEMLEYDLLNINSWLSPLKQSISIWDDFIRDVWKPIIGREEEDNSFVKLLPDDHIPLHDEMMRLLHDYWGKSAPSKTDMLQEKVPPLILGRMGGSQEAFYMQSKPLGDRKSKIHREKVISSNKTSSLVRKALQSHKKRSYPKYYRALSDTLKWYLSYVNANIVISNKLQAGFHDWSDFSPFYKRKFLSVGQDYSEVEEYKNESRKLFDLLFPEIDISDTRTLMRILHDKRIAELRQLLDSAIKGEVVFDEDFAKSALEEVVAIERVSDRCRHIVSYLSLPFDLLSWVGDKGKEAIKQGIQNPIEKRVKMKYEWFYLLSDLSGGIIRPNKRSAMFSDGCSFSSSASWESNEKFGQNRLCSGINNIVSAKLQKRVIEFLKSLSILHDSESQRAFIYQSGIDRQLQEQILFGKPPAEFVPLLVSKLLNYGKINDGRYAIEAVLESSLGYIGQEGRGDCNRIIQELKEALSSEIEAPNSHQT